MAKKEDIQELKVGGGATGESSVPAPADKSATLPASNLSNGESMQKIQDPNNPGEEETSTENNVKATSTAAASNKASIAAKTSAAVKEDIDAMFSGEELSEDFKEKAVTIFEAAVATRVEQIVEEMQAEQAEAVEAQVAEITEGLSATVNEYLDYVVEQWMEENKVAIEHSLRTEVTEGFINGLHKLFAENYLEVPEDKVDVVEELAAKVEELEAKLNDSINENIELKSVVAESQKEKIFADVTEGLAATQVEKLRTLSEGVEFGNAETYAKKLQIVKESYFADSKKSSVTVLTEENGIEEAPVAKAVDPSVAKYVSAISRTVKK